MKLFYAIAVILMVLASACAQQTATPAAPQAAPQEPQAPPAQPEPAPEPETAAPMEEKAPEAKSNEVRMLGIGKYEPLEAKISAGGTVTFLNEGNLKTVITIKSKGKVVNTQVIQPGSKYEQLFAEAGTYEFWGVAYGQAGAKIIVE